MTVQVGKLTVRTAQRGAGRDAGFRVRNESLLRSLELQPPGLPERAVLVVRRIELAPIDGSTAQRTRAALTDLRRMAARPAADPVEASANAVLFGDEVELLACLTADLVHGVAGRRWYWREIVSVVSAEWGAEAGAAGLAATWVSHARWLPATLARLSEPEARNAVSLLSPPQTSRVLRALLTAFGVDERPSPRSPADPPTPEPAVRPPGEPPWRRWLRASSLDPHAEALLGVALSLHHAPALVRRPAYAERLAIWRAATDDASRPRPPSREAPATAAAAARRRRRRRRDPQEEARSTAAPSGYADPGTRWSPAVPSAEAATVAEAPTGPAAGGAAGERPMAGADGAAHTIEEPSAELPEDGDVAASGTSTWAEEGIATDLASLLFLVSFVVWLDSEEDTLVPTGWALVELLGRHLLGAQLADFAADPLWDVLAKLDGRRVGTPPAIELGAADPLRLPQAWLRRWPAAPPTYVAHRSGERLVVRHPEGGFVAADVPCPPGRLDEVRAAEAALLRDAEIIAGAPATGAVATPEQRFGDAVGAFVAWLLRSRGIGVSSLAAPGRVRVTGTHVDVVLSLQDVDLAARVAGLDRDPGWVPVLGRIVLFHFLAAP